MGMAMSSVVSATQRPVVGERAASRLLLMTMSGFHDRRLETRLRAWAGCAIAVLAGVGAGCFGPAGRAAAATTTYSTATGPFTINAGDTALLIDGAQITGDVTNNGTLEFGLTDGISVTNVISGSGNVLLSASGTITFTGSNSYLNGTTIQYGQLVITSGGAIDHPDADVSVEGPVGSDATLRVTGGSVSSRNGVLGFATNTLGTAVLTSGTWANTLDLVVGGSGTGLVTVSGGLLSNRDGNLGFLAGGVGAVSVTSGTWANARELNVGYGGTGSLTLQGGSVTSLDSTIGATATSSGTATVSAGTWTTTRDMIVGFGGGAGRLDILGTGVVVVGGSLSRDAARGTINLQSGGTLVIGTGTTSGSLETSLVNDGTLIFDRSDLSQYTSVIGGTGVVIKRGAGTLQLTGVNTYSGGTTILGGRIELLTNATIDQPAASIVIGDSGSAVGGLTVTGGSVASALLTVHNGDVNLSAGSIDTGVARIGILGSGTAAVSGGIWNVDDLVVGSGGTGTLTISGGTVVSSTATLGELAGDSGTAVVTGGGVWDNLGNLAVGAAGTGTLTIADSGQVFVTGTLSRGAGGTINLNVNGTLQIGTGGATGTLATDLVNNGTLVFSRSSASTYHGVVSGSGAVTKSGVGALTFTGTSSYIGPTTVNLGAFYVDGQLGDTQVTVNTAALVGGSGTILGTVFINSGGVLSPGSAGDELAILGVGGLDLQPSSITRLSVEGTQAGVTHDQIAGLGVSPVLHYGGRMEITLSGSYADQTTFHLYTNFGRPTGDFGAVTLAATGAYGTLSGSMTFDAASSTWSSGWTSTHQKIVFSQVSGDLIVVPEPSAMVLGGLGVGAAWLLRRRKARRADAAGQTSAQAR